MKDRLRKKLWKRHWLNLLVRGYNYNTFTQTRWKRDKKHKYTFIVTNPLKRKKWKERPYMSKEDWEQAKEFNRYIDKISKNNNNK